jgi:pimeloyl-ACP methyl ester carboxylesterase
MRAARFCIACLVILLPGISGVPARAGDWFGQNKLDRINSRLNGCLVDYTHNHGADHRIWSEALHQKRDLYVYLPPGFDPAHCYPVIFWLHAFLLDEHLFAKTWVEMIDTAMSAGELPPAIIAVADGSLPGRISLNPCIGSSFFLNSNAGNFEDFIIQDVWDFVLSHYPIRPERECHVLFGVSMGGFAAYNLGIKYRDRFGVIVGVLPPLNLRWVDCHGRYMADFDPCCWGWRTNLTGHEVVGRFYGVITLRSRAFIDRLYGRGPHAVAEISRENPIEMLDTFHVCPGELAMYVGYAGRDNFNLDAQTESFLYCARQRGLCVAVGCDPHGGHDLPTARRLMPGALQWLAGQLAPLCPH